MKKYSIILLLFTVSQLFSMESGNSSPRCEKSKKILVNSQPDVVYNHPSINNDTEIYSCVRLTNNSQKVLSVASKYLKNGYIYSLEDVYDKDNKLIRTKDISYEDEHTLFNTLKEKYNKQN